MILTQLRVVKLVLRPWESGPYMVKTRYFERFL